MLMVYGANDSYNNYRTDCFYFLKVLKKAARIVTANFNSRHAVKAIDRLWKLEKDP